jgi:hypothetical protein
VSDITVCEGFYEPNARQPAKLCQACERRTARRSEHWQSVMAPPMVWRPGTANKLGASMVCAFYIGPVIGAAE